MPPSEATRENVRVAFAELCRLPGGGVRAARVLAQFQIAHVDDAPAKVLQDLLAALTEPIS